MSEDTFWIALLFIVQGVLFVLVILFRGDISSLRSNYNVIPRSRTLVGCSNPIVFNIKTFQAASTSVKFEVRSASNVVLWTSSNMTLNPPQQDVNLITTIDPSTVSPCSDLRFITLRMLKASDSSELSTLVLEPECGNCGTTTILYPPSHSVLTVNAPWNAALTPNLANWPDVNLLFPRSAVGSTFTVEITLEDDTSILASTTDTVSSELMQVAVPSLPAFAQSQNDPNNLGSVFLTSSFIAHVRVLLGVTVVKTNEITVIPRIPP